MNMENPLNPEQAKGTAEEQEAQQDYVVLRLVALGLTSVALVTAVGVMVLAGIGEQVPEGVLSFGSAAVGALATMMTRSVRRSK